MVKKRHHILLLIANILIFFAVIIFDTSEILNISIKTATPMIFLPLLCSYSFFANIKSCIAVGLISGAFVDSVSYRSYCFNTILLMIIAVSVCLCANNLFNKNIRAAVVLTLLASTLYFVMLWLVFYGFNSDIESSLGYLLKYALPSALYSTVIVFPFYFIYKKFNKIKEHQ